ncbi:hypothetical protein RHSIM_Rhsim06G0140600 [Rhododendron simsii]|uniref:dihydroorotase n=1 Tax=Rhododendron simsii TaxID=118357 RepID=A0A834GQN4_RHOSS|nr:hypothetical protein RHSIM_Rhsim06G0140600 [Rhododendron simsii]
MIKALVLPYKALNVPSVNVVGRLNPVKATGAKMEVSITRPDDWHLHLRDGDLLEAVVSHRVLINTVSAAHYGYSAFHFGRGIIMPNLKPPIKTTAAAISYRESILKAIPTNCDFTPLMTLYLTDTTSPEEIKLAKESGVVYAVKLYPAGATTNSQDGVTDLFGKCLPVLEEMMKQNMPLLNDVALLEDPPLIVASRVQHLKTIIAAKLLDAIANCKHQIGRAIFMAHQCAPSNQEEANKLSIGWQCLFQPHRTIAEGIISRKEKFIGCRVHGEVSDPEVDIFDREKVFIDAILRPLIARFPRLKVVMEHVTTEDAVKFVESWKEGFVAATVTPQHLVLNRNSLFQGGLQPHNYCLPVLKREIHRRAVVSAVTSGSKRFFLGTDSAPHDRRKKECSCGCAGIFNAFVALSVYAKVFEEAGALDKLEAFTSFNGPDFYGLPRNTTKVKLIRSPWKVPESLPYASGEIVPMFAGETLEWLPLSLIGKKNVTD